MESEENNLKFYGEKVRPIIHIFETIIIFILFSFIWFSWNSTVLPNLQQIDLWNIFLWLLWIVLWLLLISLPILCYFSNKKSYIELTNMYINIYKPKHYPLYWNMESIKFWYEKIEDIKIYFIPKFTFKYNVIITTISENWKKEKNKFYRLSNWKALASALKVKWIKTEYI